MPFFSRLIACVFIGLPIAAPAEDRVVTFNRDIRPLLSENCYHCHGPDESARQAGLRLDTEDGAKEWAIVPGDAQASELVTRVMSDDPDQVMPPPDSERSLSAEQQKLIERWVSQGASYQQHWSFQRLQPVAVPQVDSDWAANPIDRFVLAGLRDSPLSPAPPAPRETLIRRISFDLTGLPPTLDQIDRYLADPSPSATENLIDRMLADPRFGERMAAAWLDVARYSDTYGYQVDRDRFVWPWRDWVIAAFNRNLGYDQFLTEQLAGDLLPGAEHDQILATTFNRLHPQKVEGGSVPEEFRVEYVADRTQTVGTAFLGLTMECCRCHSHKYDPITQQEYYQLSAFFANIDEAGLYSFFTSSVPTPTLPLPTEAEQQRLEQLHHDVDHLAAEFQSALASDANVSPDQLQAFRRRVLSQTRSDSSPDDSSAAAEDHRDPPEPGVDEAAFAKPIESLDFETAPKPPNSSVAGVLGNAVKLTGDDPVNLSQGNFRREQPFSVSLWMKTPDEKSRAVVFHRSRAWTDAGSRGYQLLIEDGRLSWSLIHFWPGNALRIRTTNTIPVEQWIHVTVTHDGSSTAGGLGICVDGQKADVEVVRDQLTKNITGGGGDHLTIGERFRDRGFTGGQVDQFHVFDVQLTPLEIQRLAAKETIPDWLRSPVESWTADQRRTVAEHLAMRNGKQSRRIREQLIAARGKYYRVQDAVKEIMVMRELPSPRTTYRLNRGAYDDRGEPVPPGTPKALGPFDASRRRDRLGLARWMLQEDHPLTSRVAANRLWQLCFGVGLVRTPEDFGSQGEPPTHPELLDWLANDLVQHDWDVKRAIKQILLSSTYQQSSRNPDEKAVRLDPENRLLARHTAYRLSAEMLRDQALGLSGLLVDEIGGPPVKPYEVEASFKPSQRDQGAGLYRRSLYTYWKRTGPAPAMMTLDASKRDVCRVRRERTSSPLQAFVLLNGPQYVEASRSLALRLTRRHAGQTDALLCDAFRVLTGRQPKENESAVLRELYRDQLDYFSSDPDRVDQFLNVGEDRVPDADRTPSLAASAVVIGTLMNFDECVIKR
ncbi:DUF1553 domain-containing protein [Roseiconus nitratireducens]|uniref:DUF1553 domain-containing protein n=1 Tax=Roseiconus nitratireducens TaxID=2605748 RepID=A0A5M6DFZ6_9BACT|nr:DUF1553 domain-containing protein [Roseiconus nitratireducens]KAA5545212.1 DUF1553 domain-containing protein [Roseiconus nitratireducens]